MLFGNKDSGSRSLYQNNRDSPTVNGADWREAVGEAGARDIESIESGTTKLLPVTQEE